MCVHVLSHILDSGSAPDDLAAYTHDHPVIGW